MKKKIFILVICQCITIVAITAQTSGDYRTKQTGTWNAASTWQTYNVSTWIDAISSPTSSNGVINIQSGHTISSSTSVTVDQVVINSNAALNITAGNFTVNDGSGNDVSCSGTINLSGGTMDGAGLIKVLSGGTFAWTGGNNSGSGILTIDAGAVFNMSGGGHNLQGTKTINNYGTWNWTAGRFYYYDASPTVNNYGTFNISTDEDIYEFLASSGKFNNMPGGVINKTGSLPGETWITGLSLFSNAGRINVNSGLLKFYVKSVHSGTINVNAGANINFFSDSANFNAGSKFMGAGNINLDGAPVSINAPVTTSTNTFNLITGSLVGASTLAFKQGSIFNWTGGNNSGSGIIKIDSGAVFNMSGGAHALQGTKTINNRGTWNWTAGSLSYFATSPVVNNYGTFNINTDDDILQFTSNSGKFNNMPGGVINKTGSLPGETWITGFNLFSNAGRININSGLLRFYVKSAHSGTINLKGGANINFYSDTANFNAGSKFMGAGNVNFDGAPVNINAPVNTSTNTFNLIAGTLAGASTLTFKTGSAFNWTGGNNSGSGIITIDSGAVFNMSGGAHALQGTKTINNHGTWNWTAGGLSYFATSPVINNYGSFNIVTDDDISQFTANSGSFNNMATGVINKIGSPTGETTIHGFAVFKNEGAINLNPGNLALNVAGVHNGNYTISFGSQLRSTMSMAFTGTSITNDGKIAVPNLSFSGAFPQSLEGSGSINTLTINNINNATLVGRQTINNLLTLTKGKILLGSYDLIIGNLATFSGGHDSSYVFTNGTGCLQRRVKNNDTAVSFPIGDANGYAPLNILLPGSGTGDNFKVHVIPNLYSAYDVENKPIGNAINSNVVTHSWIISEAINGGSRATVSPAWKGAEEAVGFNRAESRFGYYSSAGWDLDTAKAASGNNPYTLSGSYINSFGPFGIINQFVSCLKTYTGLCPGKAFNVPYKAIGSFNPGNIFTAQLSNAAGSFASPVNIGSITAAASGSINATIPASTPLGNGYRIRIKSTNPSTVGPNNGTNISIKNCPGFSVNSKADSIDINSFREELPFNKIAVYPNPTYGKFVLNMQFKEITTGTIQVRLQSMNGRVIQVETVPVSNGKINKTILISPSTPSGIYMLRVISGSNVYSEKIIYLKP